MQELLDKQLDNDITRTLRFETLVTPAQQSAARERLLKLAAEQTILPPVVEEEDTASRLIEMASLVKNRSLKLLHMLILDSEPFERVPRKPTQFHYFLDRHGRFTRPILSLSA